MPANKHTSNTPWPGPRLEVYRREKLGRYVYTDTVLLLATASFPGACHVQSLRVKKHGQPAFTLPETLFHKWPQPPGHLPAVKEMPIKIPTVSHNRPKCPAQSP